MRDNRKNILNCTMALLLGLCVIVPPSSGLCAAATASEARKGYDEDGVIIPDEYDGWIILEDPELIAAEEDDEPSANTADEPDISTTPTPEPTIEPTADPSKAPTAEPSLEPTTAPTTEPITSPEPTATPEATGDPSPEYRYAIEITPPTGWRNTASAKAGIKVTDETGNGWSRIFVKIGGSGWQEVTEAFLEADSLDINVQDNGLLVVRVTDPDGENHEETAQVACFDRTPPSVTAGIRNVLLHVEATDALSGVAGIQVNGLLFTVLDDGVLDVRMEKLLNDYEKLGIRAYDYAGNFSEPVMLDNPYYSAVSCPTCPPNTQAPPTQAPATQPPPTQAPPTQAPKATKKPSGSGGQRHTPQPTLLPTAVAPTPTLIPQVIATLTPVIATPMPTPDYIEISPGTPLSPSGNMQSLDLLYSKATNKQFISVQTRSGETYFLIIDYDKPIDAEAEIYETYFLNLVDDRDLLAVLKEDELPTPEPTVVFVTPAPTMPSAAQPTEMPASNSNNSMNFLALLFIALLAGGGMMVWFFKFRKDSQAGRKKTAMSEFDFDEEEIDEDTEDDTADE